MSLIDAVMLWTVQSDHPIGWVLAALSTTVAVVLLCEFMED